ncbi:hypothetical protein B0H10DRAFT_2163532 [Mycena sp. CBHHK59/15]|nr:hypothetical protein B0H10DRAFT_2163532 [Mycena sp. CBHHK59/15]
MAGVSHTGKHLVALLLEVMKMIGVDHFTAVGSDSTGNTKLARKLVAEEVLMLLIVPDPCHHLSNTVKDICGLVYFVEVILKMRETITYFSHSMYSATHLKALRVILKINKGLVKIGKTRFGTLYCAGHSVHHRLPAITELITSGVINTDGADKVCQTRVDDSTFELELQQLIAILELIARVIKCLEGLDVTVGDVWKFYVAITAVLRDLFAEDCYHSLNLSRMMSV